MREANDNTTPLEICPVTADRWDDLVELFAGRGTVGGCWCMWFRRPRKEFSSAGGRGNRRAMESIVRRNEVPGMLAYLDARPVGWCSLSPRESYGSLERSRVLRRVDDQPVWSIVCFYILPTERNKKVAESLLGAAVSYAAEQGAELIEAYPREGKDDLLPDGDAFTGPLSMFKRAGFKEVARHSEGRPIMRFSIADFLKVAR
jgi:GNAT superfamily N-acetyltransferase